MRNISELDRRIYAQAGADGDFAAGRRRSQVTAFFWTLLSFLQIWISGGDLYMLLFQAFDSMSEAALARLLYILCNAVLLVLAVLAAFLLYRGIRAAAWVLFAQALLAIAALFRRGSPLIIFGLLQTVNVYTVVPFLQRILSLLLPTALLLLFFGLWPARHYFTQLRELRATRAGELSAPKDPLS